MAKAIGKAFLVGGIMGVITQLFLVLYAAVLPQPMVDMHLHSTFALVTLGLLTLVTYPSGLFDRVQAWGGWGIMLTFSGLAGAVAGCYQGVLAHTGSVAKAIGQGFKLVFTIVGIGFIPIAIVMLIVAFAL